MHPDISSIFPELCSMKMIQPASRYMIRTEFYPINTLQVCLIFVIPAGSLWPFFGNHNLIDKLIINQCWKNKNKIRYMQYYKVFFRNIMRGIHILFCQRSISSLRALRSLFQQLFGIGGYLYDNIGRPIYQSTVVLKIFKPYYFLL